MEEYINPFIDYGFKKLFATEANKDLLISLLNAIIEDVDDPVVDLTYKNVEQISEYNGTRINYFDVYCETQNKREFIVEMQNSWKPFFKDRTVYYAAKPIRNQGLVGIQKTQDQLLREKVAKRIEEDLKEIEEKREREFKKSGKKWNYRLNDVYLIAIMNFTFPKKEYGPESYFHKVMLTDIDDHHVFYDKLTLYYVEMPKLENIELKLDTPREKWFYALYNLWCGNDRPEELDEYIFRKLYEQARIASFTLEQQFAYEDSRMYYLDTYAEIEGGFIMGREQGYEWGFEKGREKGLAESAAQNKIAIVQRMKALGIDKEIILKSVEMTEEEFDNL